MFRKGGTLPDGGRVCVLRALNGSAHRHRIISCARHGRCIGHRDETDTTDMPNEAKMAADALEAALSLEVDRLPSPLGALVYHAMRGGKRLRPRLTVAFAAGYGGARGDAFRLGIAVEFIHRASLIQDDLPCMDAAEERSGYPALHAHCSPAEAVLTSDLMIAHAFRICAESTHPAESVTIVSAAVADLCRGQAQDLRSSGATPRETDWRDVCDAKTGALFVAAAKLGVVTAGRTDGDVMRIATRFGRALGRLYQWHDDTTDGDAGPVPAALAQAEISAIGAYARRVPTTAPILAFLDLLAPALHAVKRLPANGSRCAVGQR